MTGKYTPGPWPLYNCCDVWRLTSPNGAEILTSHYVGDDFDGDHEGAIEDEANARLIAAAPDLLEAAKDASNLLEVYADFTENYVSGEHIRDALRRINAAIAKAEGRE